MEIIGRLIGEAAVLSIEGQASKRFLVHELIGQCAAVGIGALRNRTGDRRVLGARHLAARTFRVIVDCGEDDPEALDVALSAVSVLHAVLEGEGAVGVRRRDEGEGAVLIESQTLRRSDQLVGQRVAVRIRAGRKGAGDRCVVLDARVVLGGRNRYRDIIDRIDGDGEGLGIAETAVRVLSRDTGTSPRHGSLRPAHR